MTRQKIAFFFILFATFFAAGGVAIGSPKVPSILLQTQAPTLEQIIALDNNDLQSIEAHSVKGMSKVRERLSSIHHNGLDLVQVKNDLDAFLDLIVQTYLTEPAKMKLVGVGSDSLFISRALEAKIASFGHRPNVEWLSSPDSSKRDHIENLTSYPDPKTIDAYSNRLIDGNSLILFGFVSNPIDCKWIGNRILDRICELNTQKDSVKLEVIGLQDRPFLGNSMGLGIPKNLLPREPKSYLNKFKRFFSKDISHAESASSFLGLTKALSWGHAVSKDYLGIAKVLKAVERRALFLSLFRSLALVKDIDSNLIGKKPDERNLDILKQIETFSLEEMTEVLFSEQENDIAKTLLTNQAGIKSFFEILRNAPYYDEQVARDLLLQIAIGTFKPATSFWKSLPLKISTIAITLGVKDKSLAKLVSWFVSTDETLEHLINNHQDLITMPRVAEKLSKIFAKGLPKVSTSVIETFAHLHNPEVSKIAKVLLTDRKLLAFDSPKQQSTFSDTIFAMPALSGFTAMSNSGDDLTQERSLQGDVVLNVIQDAINSNPSAHVDLLSAFSLPIDKDTEWLQKGDMVWYLVALLQHLRANDLISTFDLLNGFELIFKTANRISWNTLIQLASFRTESGACEYILKNHDFENSIFESSKAFDLISQSIIDIGMESAGSATPSQRISIISSSIK